MATSRTGTTSHRAWRRAILREGKITGVYTCPVCGIVLDYQQTRQPNSAEPDHIIPFSRGGKNTLDNGRVICRRCNQQIGATQKRNNRKRANKSVKTIDFRVGD